MIQLARDARLYPGEGCIDFAGVVERMPPVYYSIELPNQSRVRELGYEEHARRCLQHARAVMGEAQSRRLPVSLDLSPSASSSTRSSHLESLHA